MPISGVTGPTLVNVGSTGGGTGVADAVTEVIDQTAHGFSVGDVIRYDGAEYTLSQADQATNADVDGIVSAINNSDEFVITAAGHVPGLSGLTAGTQYFLDPFVAGNLSATEPTTPGQVSKPLLKADSTTSGWFVNFRGLVVPPLLAATYNIKVVDDATAITTGDSQLILVIPSELSETSLFSIAIYVTTVSTSGLVTIQIRNITTGFDMLTTPATIDVNEKNSYTAATPAVVDGAHAQVSQGNEIAVDVDVAGTGAKGLGVILGFE